MQVDNTYDPQDNSRNLTNYENILSSKNTYKPLTAEVSIKCPCRQSINTKNMMTCATCKTQQHQDCMKDLSKMQNYQCPTCQLSESDFFIKPLFNILQPTLIKNEKSDAKFSQTFQVELEFLKILEKVYLISPQNMKYVMIRCLRLEEEGYEHHWPFNCVINVNGTTLKTLNLPKYPPRSKSRVDYPITFYFKPEDINQTQNYHNLHKEYFFFLSRHLNLVPLKKNVIDLKIDYRKNDNDKYSYVISIDLVEVIKDKEEVINSIPVVSDIKVLKSILNPNLNQIVNPNSKQIDNMEEITSSEKVNLIDCYTNSHKIRIPVRSINCSHLKIFDLAFFLQINRKNKSYECPICKKKATRLYVDGFIAKYLKDFPNVSEVVLSQNYEISNVLLVKDSCEGEIDNGNLGKDKVKTGSALCYDKISSGLNNISSSKTQEFNVIDIDLEDNILVSKELNSANNANEDSKKKQNSSNILDLGSSNRMNNFSNLNLTANVSSNKFDAVVTNTNTHNLILKLNENYGKTTEQEKLGTTENNLLGKIQDNIHLVSNFNSNNLKGIYLKDQTQPKEKSLNLNNTIIPDILANTAMNNSNNTNLTQNPTSKSTSKKKKFKVISDNPNINPNSSTLTNTNMNNTKNDPKKIFNNNSTNVTATSPSISSIIHFIIKILDEPNSNSKDNLDHSEFDASDNLRNTSTSSDLVIVQRDLTMKPIALKTCKNILYQPSHN